MWNDDEEMDEFAKIDDSNDIEFLDDEYDDEYVDVEILTDEEEEETAGGATAKRVPALAISASSVTIKVGESKSLFYQYTGDGMVKVSSSNPSIIMADVIGKNIKLTGKKMGTAILTVSTTATVKYKAVMKKIVATVIS